MESMDLGAVNLRPVRVLGEGTFGRVFLCNSQHGATQHNVCVKRIIVLNPKMEMGMIMEEVYIISQLKHPRIVKFIRSFVHAGTVNIVMEYVPNGTIRDIINHSQRTGISMVNLMRYFCDILMGLEYLHIRHVIHRDLKPENLLLDALNRIKIADFGISSIHAPGKHHFNAFGTPYYLAPEIMRGKKFDFKSDIWSLGCVLYEMCIGRSPFQKAHNLDELRYLIRVLTQQQFDCHAIIERYGSVWAQLCKQMLVYDPRMRISLPNILCLHHSITLTYYKQYFDYQY